MTETSPRRSARKFFATTAVATLCGGLAFSALPTAVLPAFADAVRVEAPQAPSFADVVDAVSPAVVSVRVQAEVKPVSDDGSFSFNFGGRGFDNLPDDHPMKRFFKEFGQRGGPDGRRGEAPGKPRVRPVSQGSGFFISDDGYIVTNDHVVKDGKAFTIILNDGTELDAKLVGTDPRTDLAVLKVEKPDRKFTYVGFADDQKVRVGDWVVAVGNPFGLGGTVTAGIVSARGRDIGAGPYDDFIQVDAAVNRGNSGGPTFNLSGEVIGVNTAIFSPSGGNVGIAFAIPATTARNVVADLMKDGTVKRGWLGVQIQPVTKDIAESLGLADASGALVSEPQDGTPAKKAGIVAGDVVTAVNGEAVKDPRDLARRIAAIDSGKTAEIAIWRNGKSETKTITIGEMPSEEKMASLDPAENDGQTQGEAARTLDRFGLTVVPAEDGRGVVVTDVDPDSSAGNRGLQTGDVIVSVNSRDVKSADDILSVIDTAAKAGRKAALFQVENNDRSRFVALPIDLG